MDPETPTRPAPAPPAEPPSSARPGNAPAPLRERLQRHLDSLPEAQLLQVLDYAEFLSSRYAREPVQPAPSLLGRFGERFQDKLRARRVGLDAMRGALEVIAAADRLFAAGTRNAPREQPGAPRAHTEPDQNPHA